MEDQTHHGLHEHLEAIQMQADGHPLQENEHESIEIAANHHASVSEEDIKPKIRGHSRLFTVLRCSKCNKRFRNPSLLQQHVKLHRGSTVYRCRQCRENFRELNKFLEHRLVHPPSRKRRRTLESNGFQLVKELKRILLSYREKVSGTKADLVLRTYAILCRALQADSKNSSASVPTTPSSETEKSALTYEEIFRSRCGHLPWVSDLRNTPPFSFIQLYEYLVVKTFKYNHIVLKSTAYKKLKSFQFFYEGFIKKFSVAKDNDCTYFDIRMKASMKNTLYKVLVVLDNSTGDVSCAACTCPAGVGLGGFGKCNHVGGVLFALEDFNRKGYQECPEPVSCTSTLSAWNVPSSTKVVPLPIDEMIIAKIRFASDKEVDARSLEDLKLKLAACNPNSCFFSFHDAPTELTVDEEMIYHEVVPSLDSPFGKSNVQLKQLFDVQSNAQDSKPFNDFYDISCQNFKEMMDIYCENNSLLSEEEILTIERMTIGQSLSQNWIEQRMYRITASRFYSASVNSVEPSSKLQTFFYSSFSSPALEHGKKSESFARSLYLQTMSEKGFQGICVEETGLKISSKFSFLGASLDGLVHFNGEKWGLEIKCPYSKSSLSSALEDKKFFLKKGKVISLKRSHPYFYQIQGQMYCTGLKRELIWLSGLAAMSPYLSSLCHMMTALWRDLSCQN
eukprot:gene3488-1870_t